jgi:hypothetical protein
MPRPRRARGLSRGLLLLSIVLLVIPVDGRDGSSQEAPPPSPQRSSIGLFASPTVRLAGNRVECGISNEGQICANYFGSPSGAGANWPLGTPDGYIFASGLQVAGINGPAAGPWASDTVAAYFHDHTGSMASSTALTDIYDSTDPDDVAAWPEDAAITDFELYDPRYAGQQAISAQDTWVRYWDGDPEYIQGRQHPMGIEVTQRTHAWNYPHGNADILYFVLELRNVTHEPEFQLPNELAFFAGEDSLPDEGWPIEEFYVGYYADVDVADAGSNYATAIFPFNLGVAYHGGFDAPRFEYPPAIFHPPFFAHAPGFVATALTRTPGDELGERGLTLFTVHLGAGPGSSFPEFGTAVRLWGTLSGKSDAFSSVTPQVDTGEPATMERSVGTVYQEPHDARMILATGPFRLDAGERETVVLAIVFAATVETMPDGSPSGILGNSYSTANPPGTPSFHPGFASARGCDPDGNNCTVVNAVNPVKSIERGAGWVSYSGPAPAGRTGGALEGPENRLPLRNGSGRPTFELVPESLLWKALLAREFVDSGFGLLPAPPEPPPFNLIPGEGTVTVEWWPSPTEEHGDPFWTAASDSASPFYNPNYRRYDVQLYRIWRQAGGEPDLTPIATFAVPDRPFVDFTCETVEPEEELGTLRVDGSGDTVEVRGYSVGEICALGASPVVRDTTVVFNNGSPGGSPGGGVARGAGLEAVPVRLDTLTFGEFAEAGFIWTDETAVNNFTYRYAVTAVDLNSAYSGPVSQESEIAAQHVVPRGEAGRGKVVHTVPDPYLGGSQYDLSPQYRQLMFVNLPPRATVRIYSLGGRLIRQLEHSDATGGGRLAWGMRDLNNYHISSGVYFFHVATPEGDETVGKFTVVMGTTWP